MKVGVVIPVYYGRQHLAETLRSVEEQSFLGSREVIVIEDGTAPESMSEDICRKFSVEYYYEHQNRGVMASRILGASRLSADVDWLALLDQDDCWHPEFLTKMIEALETRPRVGLVACNARMTEDGGNLPLWQERVPSLRLEDLKVANQIVSPSQVVMRYKAWKESLSVLQGDLRGGADDWLLWLAILSRGYESHYLPEMLVDYRVHQGGAHLDQAKMRQSQEEVVGTWFPRLGFTRHDQRRFHGRVTFDRLVEGVKERRWDVVRNAAGRAVHDPWAVWQGFQFRRRHKQQGLV